MRLNLTLRGFFCLISALFIVQSASAQALFPVQWGKSPTPEFALWDTVKVAFTLKNDGKIITGYGGYNSYNSTHQTIISSLNTSGTILWEKKFEHNKASTVKKIVPSSALSEPGSFYAIGGSAATNGIYNGHLGYLDAWVMKMDSLGNISTLKHWGEITTNEIFYSGANTSSGHFLAVGQQFPFVNYVDLYNFPGSKGVLTKFDAGTLDTAWSRIYPEVSVLYDIKELSNGDYIAVGDMARTATHTYGQAVVLVLDSSGAIKWSKAILSNAVVELNDPLAKINNSGFCNNVFEFNNQILIVGNHYFQETSADVFWNNSDIVITALTMNGQLSWQKKYGGSSLDFAEEATMDAEGRLLIAGLTLSFDGDIPYRMNTNGVLSDMWYFQVDNSGNLVKSIVIGGSSFDGGMYAKALPGGDWITAGHTDSEDLHFGSDAVGFFHIPWVGRLYSNSAAINGFAYSDKNQSGTFQPGEPGNPAIQVFAVQGTDTIATTLANQNGFFKLLLPVGSFDIKFVSLSQNYIIPTQSITVVLNQLSQRDTVRVAMQPVPGKRSLATHTTAITAARPGFMGTYNILLQNNGTIDLGDSVRFVLDPRTTDFQTSAAFARRGDTIKFAISPLAPGESKNISVTLRYEQPPFLNNGDTLTFISQIFPIVQDLAPADNNSVLRQLVTGSYDPNDKTESHAGVLTQEQIDNGEYLNYLIRFQNTGTDTAFTVIVCDTLESRLDLSSLEMLTASHDYFLNIEDGNKLKWTFADINLADSNINEPLSHGYIQFRIKPLPTFLPGDTMRNTASIYFDYNLPVITNQAKTAFKVAGALPVRLIGLRAFRKDGVNQVEWITAAEDNMDNFEVERRMEGGEFKSAGSVKARGHAADYLFRDYGQTQPGNMYYRLKINDIGGSFIYSDIVLVRNEQKTSMKVFPNPVDQFMRFDVTLDAAETVQLKVLNAEGRLLKLYSYQLQAGKNVRAVDLDDLIPGTYIINLVRNSEVINSVIIKK